ncbi:hypothetical protein [Streptomyces sp. NPDC020330]|uniref:hypothetical protein n=1 Tax=unclassified Streptomyces TaxID=2593676 RepID=UPI0037B0BFE8
MPGEFDQVGHSMVPLKSLLKKIETGWSPVCEPKPPAADEWGVLRLSAVTSGTFIESEAKRFPDQLTPRPAHEVKSGDVLMSRANGVKALVGVTCSVGDVRPKLLLPDLVFRLVPDPGVLDAEFLSIALTSVDARRQIDSVMRGTSGQYKISQADVRGLEIPDLRLPDQRRIVAAHAAFGQRIAALEQSWRKLRIIEKSVTFRAMAEAKRRVPLGEWLDRIDAGRSPLAEDVPAGDAEWGVLKVSAVQAGWFHGAENKVVRAPELINPHYEVRSGDLLMTRANTEQLVGLACVALDPAPRLMLSDKTLRIVPVTARAEAGFIELALLSPDVRRQIRGAATGTSGSMKNIAQAAVKELLVPDVPVGTQRQIVATMAASRKRSSKMRDQVAKLRTVRQGMVEDLLSGRARLTE